LLNRYFPLLFAEAETIMVFRNLSETRAIIVRALIALIVIVYFVGVGVVLSPVIQAEWKSASASNLAASVRQAPPNALAWPTGIYHGMTEQGWPRLTEGRTSVLECFIAMVCGGIPPLFTRTRVLIPRRPEQSGNLNIVALVVRATGTAT
jgi:hypothetical protein